MLILSARLLIFGGGSNRSIESIPVGLIEGRPGGQTCTPHPGKSLNTVSHAEFVCLLCQSKAAEMMTNTRNPAAVREPSVEELGAFGNLCDIMQWAAIKGDPTYAFSHAGSLLYLLAGDEFNRVEAIGFASITPDDFEEALTTWMYSADDTDHFRGREPELNLKPPAIVKARARATHRATQLWNLLEWSTQAVTSYK